jgi:cell division protein FtsB
MKGKRNIVVFLVLFFIVLGALFIFFNENGYLKYIELKEKVADLQSRIDTLSYQNKRLEEEIDSLTRKVPAKIEQTAREKYDMLRKGEIKVEIIEK